MLDLLLELDDEEFPSDELLDENDAAVELSDDLLELDDEETSVPKRSLL